MCKVCWTALPGLTDAHRKIDVRKQRRKSIPVVNIYLIAISARTFCCIRASGETREPFLLIGPSFKLLSPHSGASLYLSFFVESHFLLSQQSAIMYPLSFLKEQSRAAY